MPADTALIYELALAEGDQYPASLAAILNGVGPACVDKGCIELVAGAPDY